jgi:hypothetical protein
MSFDLDVNVGEIGIVTLCAVLSPVRFSRTDDI